MEAVPKRRVSLEAEALRPFVETAAAYPFPVFRGQRLANCLPPRKGGFQFGDLRVETPSKSIVLEVESAGGVTNLAKYWYLIQHGFVAKPLVLLHLFAVKSAGDYASHLLLWDDLAEKMTAALGSTFTSERHLYRDQCDLDIVIARFKSLLNQDFTLG